MQFKIVDFSNDPKEIGSQYPQVQEMSKGYDYDAPNSIDEVGRFYTSLPDFEPNFNSFVLHNQAKPTDFLSNALASNGYLISERVKELLSKFNLPEHKFYPAKILFKKEHLSIKYYWFHPIRNFKKFVDYKNSEFFIYKNYSQNIGSIDVQSEQDYLEKNASLIMNDSTLCIWASKVKFLDQFPLNIDLFVISKFNTDTFISKRLSQSFIDDKITGLDIKSTGIFD